MSTSKAKKKLRRKKAFKSKIYAFEYFLPRHRRRIKANPTIVRCGTTYFTTNGGINWSKMEDVVYDTGYYNRPYASGAGIWDEKHPGPPYRSGGPLQYVEFTDPFRLSHTGTYYGWLTSTIGFKYEGGFVPLYRTQDIVPEWSPGMLQDATLSKTSALHSVGDVSSYGATGWNRFRPGNPTADLGVFLGESRDIPRMLTGTAKYFHKLWKSMGGSSSAFAPKAVADAWLNTQFGWRPFISDLRKFYETYNNLDKILKQIVRDNGRWIRRRGTVTKEIGVEKLSGSETNSGLFPTLPIYFYTTFTGSGNHTISLIKTKKVWFEGAFRYWIPDTNSVAWKARAIAEIYGAMPCPSLVWNLIPWSWLVDWFSNVGDIISNMSTGYADNLAAKYAFIMGTTEWEGRVSSTCALKQGYLYDDFVYPVTWKRREAASPFGFGLSSDDLSTRQWSILAALGITRAPGR